MQYHHLCPQISLLHHQDRRLNFVIADISLKMTFFNGLHNDIIFDYRTVPEMNSFCKGTSSKEPPDSYIAATEENVHLYLFLFLLLIQH